jgi:PAS domain S-box-containing protein
LETFRLTREEVIGKTSVELNIFDPEIRKDVLEKIKDTEELTDYEFDVNYNGRRISGLFSAKTFYIQEKKCLITSLKDITGESKLKKN